MQVRDRQKLYDALGAIQNGTAYFDEILTLGFPQVRSQVAMGGAPAKRALHLLQWAESRRAGGRRAAVVDGSSTRACHAASAQKSKAPGSTVHAIP
jgi:hypothetical protein